MSWEEMCPETKTCWCGNGTITYITEMDDWNRVRHHTQINCPICKEEADKEAAERQRREESRNKLRSEAKSIAEERYLARWLAMYSGLNKREAWKLYTGGSGYPALGTFYKHVREQGLTEYVRWCFSNDFQKALERMGVEDNDIQHLLSEREYI